MKFFATISRIRGEHITTNFIENEYWKKEIQAPKAAAIKSNLVNSN